MSTFLPTRSAVLLVAVVAAGAHANQPTSQVLEAEATRVAVVRRIAQSTLAIVDSAGQGGGSGVVISPDGYALTNFHVTAPCGPAILCGMTDGAVYDAVIVGIDPTGDVALIKMFGRDDFPAAEIGDSDRVQVGDWAYVVGNPFLLAHDFQPTVTYGVISGVHRYQYPAGTLLEYADCLQTDAAINPGNSGGPLFNADGQLIGINGRGSFEKRGRVNVGVGYAISINQINRFLGVLRSGRVVDHASLGATVTSDAQGRVVVDEILDDADAYRRGLRYDDEIVRFGGRDIGTVNAFKNVLGTYPNGSHVPITYRRDGREYEVTVRLQPLHREGELQELVASGAALPQPKPPERLPGEPLPPQQEDGSDSKATQAFPEIVRDHFESRAGFANFWFNRFHQQRLWNAFLSRGDFADFESSWTVVGQLETGGNVEIQLGSDQATIITPAAQSSAEFSGSVTLPLSPPGSGGLLDALHAWQRLLLVGPRRFGDVTYWGQVSIPGRATPVDCLVGAYRGAETRFWFDPQDGDLVGLEFRAAEDIDACEIYFDDIRVVEGRHLPHRWEVRHGGTTFAICEIESYSWSASDDEAAGTGD